MRPNNNQNKRSRGRNNNNSGGGRKHSNPLSRNYESNGPDVKIRGNASHIAEKYVQLARDAQASGDSVMAENYLQHAEHYFRIVSAAQALNPQRVEQPVQSSDSDDGDDEDQDNVSQPQPRVAEKEAAAPAEDEKAEVAAEASGTEETAEPRKPRERRPRRKPVKRDADVAEASADADAPSELPAFLTNGQTTAAE